MSQQLNNKGTQCRRWGAIACMTLAPAFAQEPPAELKGFDESAWEPLTSTDSLLIATLSGLTWENKEPPETLKRDYESELGQKGAVPSDGYVGPGLVFEVEELLKSGF